MDELIPVLTAAATLLGMQAPVAGHQPEILIPLCCNPSKLHRRRVWEAWHHSGGRCGRWSILRQLGAELRAHPHPDKLERYESPKPLVVKHVPDGPGSSYQAHWIDPHDPGADKQLAGAVSLDGWEG
jgi:hypothetical protein